MKQLRIHLNGKSYDVEVELLDDGTGAAPVAPRSSAPRRARPAAAAAPVETAAPAPKAPSGGGGAGDVVSPLAAVVVSIDVAVGDPIKEGQNVVTLEAMKMNTMVTASQSGSVKAILVAPGDAVEEGQVILTLE